MDSHPSISNNLTIANLAPETNSFGNSVLGTQVMKAASTFSGSATEDINAWITLLEIVFKATGVSGDACAANAILLLRGEALTFLHSHIPAYQKTQPGRMFPTWEELRLALKERFTPKHAWFQGRWKLRNLHQNGGCLDAYVSALRSLGSRYEIPDVELTAFFIGGLDRNSQGPVLAANPTSFEAAVCIAKSYNLKIEIPPPPAPPSNAMDINAVEESEVNALHASKKSVICRYCKNFGNFERECRKKASALRRVNNKEKSSFYLGSSTTADAKALLIIDSLSGYCIVHFQVYQLLQKDLHRNILVKVAFDFWNYCQSLN